MQYGIKQSIINLAMTWEQRASSGNYDRNYKDGLLECAHDLRSIVDDSIILHPEDTEYIPDGAVLDKQARDFLDEQNADAYLSSIAAHEIM